MGFTAEAVSIRIRRVAWTTKTKIGTMVQLVGHEMSQEDFFRSVEMESAPFNVGPLPGKFWENSILNLSKSEPPKIPKSRQHPQSDLHVRPCNVAIAKVKIEINDIFTLSGFHIPGPPCHKSPLKSILKKTAPESGQRTPPKASPKSLGTMAARRRSPGNLEKGTTAKEFLPRSGSFLV